MRPIDADLMKNTIVCDPGNRIELKLKEWIDAQKTVDVVPIWFLQDIMRQYEYEGCIDFADVIKKTIERWNKRQGERA